MAALVFDPQHDKKWGREPTIRAAVMVTRLAGMLCALASGGGAIYLIAKLYTGRGDATPMRAAVYEQPLVAIAGLAGVVAGLCIAVYPRELVAARRWLNPVWVWRARRGEALLLASGALLGLGLLEIGSRALYARVERLPFAFPPEYLVYPPLYHAMRDYDPKARNVLLLGGSVMFGAGREGKLEKELGPPWRVYTLAQNAHCSLDSLTKYRWLVAHGYRFDYVVLYEAINETRLNNAPPEVFRSDYSHYLFYRLVHAVFGSERPAWRAALHSALVFRADRLITQLRETRAFGRSFVNIAYPREDWLHYGGGIKSAAPFEANVMAIADLANQQHARLLVGEFAYDPELDDFVRGGQDSPTRDAMIAYTKEWGLPENVQKGIAAHNDILRMHRDRYDYFSTGSLKRAENFTDPCHFSSEANREFIQLVAHALTTADDNRESRDPVYSGP